MIRPFCLLIFSFMLLIKPSEGQQFYPDTFSIRTDSSIYFYSSSQIRLRNEPHFYFVINEKSPQVELTLSFPDKLIQKVELQPSVDFTILDSLTLINNAYFRGNIRFNDITNSRFLRFVFRVYADSGSFRNIEYKLYPYIFPTIEPMEQEITLFRGEEKLVPININNGFNLDYNGGWQFDDRVEYRLVETESEPKLQVKSEAIGTHLVEVVLRSNKPYLNDAGLPAYELASFMVPIKVNPSQISYLNFDQQDYFYDMGTANSRVVKIDYSGRVALNKTYRIENQEQPGGILLAELYTRSIIENENKILAVLRTYGFHREDEGYLYLKDGDITRFFTNFNILPRPQIEKISILRQGRDWTTNLSVYPNDTIEIKVEGQGMEKSRISFGDGKYRAVLDTARISDKARYYELAIPADVKESRIPIDMNGAATSFELLVREHEKPHTLTFVLMDYGAGDKRLGTGYFDKPILHYDEIKEITLSFQPKIIDMNNDFHGVQHLEVEIRINDENKRLLEFKRIENIKVVPDESSPRYASYDRKNASPLRINLSRYISRTLADLTYWSSVEIMVRHSKSKHGDNGYTKYITIYRAVETDVDLQVSFPTGLLSKQFNEPGIGRFTGISTAAQAQFTFYRKNQIAKQYPLKIGVGFIAINALTSFNADDEKDIGVVTIASFYPINSKSSVNFPLHFGFGYLFQNETAFLLVGPGVQFNF